MEFIFTPALVNQVALLFSHMFVISFQIILPIFCVLFVSEVLMGFMAKMMPQMNIFMVALPIKIGVGLVLMLAFLAPTITYLAFAIEKYMAGILKLFMGG
jgi:flagellar biosynthetic protein FliR